MLRFLPITILLILGLLISYFPIRREIAYKLGLSQDPTTSCCNQNVVTSSNGNFDEDANIAFFEDQIVDYPKTSLTSLQEQIPDTSQVLGTKNAAGEEKWIEVALDQQKLRAWEGNKIVMEYPISSGKWAPTPKGTFNIWYKTRYQKMEGGRKEWGTYYNLPNVPNSMFFHKGYAIHGAYWHNNFGQPMSHGCVNEPLAQAAAIFDWAGPVVPQGVNAVRATPNNPGTKVFVH